MNMKDNPHIKDRIAQMAQNAIVSPDQLPPHLQRYVQRAGPGDFGTFFKHPFLTTLFPIMLPEPLEEFISATQGRYEELISAGNWQGALVIVNRPFRMDMLLSMAERKEWTDEEAAKFWEAAAWVWTDAETDEENPIWGEILNCGVPGRESMMSSKDAAALGDMPDVITVYRGAHVEAETMPPEDLETHSWSISKETAEWFARRLLPDDMEPWVTIGEIRREDVIAYLTSRGESEIIAPLGAVNFVDWYEVGKGPSCDEEPSSFGI